MTSVLAALSLSAAVLAAGRRRPARRLPDLTATAGGPAPRMLRPSAPWLVVALAVGPVLVVARVAVGPVAAVTATAAAGLWMSRRRRATLRREQCTSAAIEVTAALAAELRGGRTPVQALTAAAGVAGPLRPAVDAARLAVTVGGDAAEELGRAAVLPGAERLRYVAAAWAVGDTVGARVAVALERLGEAMDEEDELRRELSAAMAGPRATMLLLAGLPLLGLALGQSVGAQPLRFLLHRPLGAAVVGGALLLDLLGVIATRAIARAALRA
jgi:tight adherence protein B